MKISKIIFRQEALGDQQRRVGSKQFVQSCPELVEGKTAAIFAREAYWHDVSTEQWRERRWRLFSTDPLEISQAHVQRKDDESSQHRNIKQFET